MQPTDTLETPEQKAKREKNRIAVAAWHKRNPDYQKNRRAAIKAGTWHLRNANPVVATPASTDPVPCDVEPPGAA